MVGVWLYGHYLKGIRREGERRVLDVIKNKLLSIEPSFNSKESEDFQRELKRAHRYLHQRLSFGAIFKEAFPFGAILLDGNLKVQWSNREFCESWGFSREKIESEALHWDHISQRTNLEEGDLVWNAVQNSLAGIYQIQAWTPTSKDCSVPFEMYVNPLEYGGQKRILIFFYP